MSLKKYSFLRTSCPELFKENSQEDTYVIIYVYGGVCMTPLVGLLMLIVLSMGSIM